MSSFLLFALGVVVLLLSTGCHQQTHTAETVEREIAPTEKTISLPQHTGGTVAKEIQAPYPLPPKMPLSTSEEQTRFIQECEDKLGPTSISVTAKPSDIVYDFTPTVEELTKKGTRQKSLNQVVLGLTQATLRHEVSWGSDMWVHPNGWACTRPSIEITLKVGPQHVSVAQEFPQGTCAFNTIATHELRHVQANQDNLESAAVTLQEQMRKFYGTQILYGDKDSLKSLMDSHIQNNWIPMLKEKLNEVDLRHNEIDSPEEYEKNQTVCDGSIPHILATRHRTIYQFKTIE